jgi:arabinofuranan 3-O-arabinosyltransferase
VNLTAQLRRHVTALSVGVLALLAYVPALASSPGRMPADTKLYLYLDPWGLVGRAASTFEPDQFAGWVPFQQITYLWPSGPWYLLFDSIGAPDWIAHRLWIATVMFLAGTGVMWTARLLGLSRSGALIAALVYQLSPFLLAYISRTSLLLLPWAGLGWIVGLTVRATLSKFPDVTGMRARLARWRDPALIGLVVATVGSTNATTLAMIVPAPVLWIIHAAWQRQIRWSAALAVAARTAVLSLAVSVWWISMLYVQSRSGAPVLSYTETLADVSRNATGSEVLRGLGYWLFYQRDLAGATTTASLDHLAGLRTIGLGYLVVIIGLVGLAATVWIHRRFAAMCVAVGAVLAVGVHPLEGSSPLMRLVLGDDEAGLALALRSSTRAVPVLLLGVGLGAGALISTLGAPTRLPAPRRRIVTFVATGVLAAVIVGSLPALWNRALVDAAIDRDQDPPAAWQQASNRLDTTDQSARVLQLPGAEFGAFRWGYTTDHPLVALTEKPVLTRDLLPLGSPGAMDLLFALDDRVQDLTVEPDAVPVAARFLGTDTIWLSNDAAFERFRTARPELVDELLTARPINGLGPVERFGEPTINVAEVDMTDPAALIEAGIGQPLAPVALVAIDEPVSVIRAKTDVVVLSGSGDGILDAAAAGLVSGYELIRSSADIDRADTDAVLDDARALIVTDTNRDQARHWRGSQDTRGHTEAGGPGLGVLTATSADQRLAVFADDADLQTVAIQDGPVTAIASSYGEPFAYRPEDRAVMAIDGDPTTAWRVGDHGDPLGERIELTVTASDAEVTSIRLVQAPRRNGDRSIAAVRVTVDNAAPVEAVLDTSSRDGGQTIEIPPAVSASTITIEITEVSPGEFPLAAAIGGVGFAEIDLGLGATTEWIRPPVDGLERADRSTPLALVFTRLRVDPTDPWRADPERHLARRFDLPSNRDMDVVATVRLDPGASDTDLAALLNDATSGGSTPIASARVTGGYAQRGVAAVDGDPSTAWMTPFDEAVGSSLRFDDLGPLGEVLVLEQPAATPSSPITAVRVERVMSAGDPVSVELVVPPPDANGRSEIALPPDIAAATGALTITITGIDPRTTIDRRYGDPRILPAAISELTSTVGIDIVSVDGQAAITSACDPEDTTGPLLELDGRAVPLALSTTTVGALLAGGPVEARSCTPLALREGTNELVTPTAGLPGLTVDRVVLSDPELPPPATADSLIAVDLQRNDPRACDVEVAACPDGCWVVLGEGFNLDWEAALDGRTLGPPVPVDGGFNGWRLPPNTEPSTVTFRWTAQTPVTLGLAVSALVALACIAIAVVGVRGRIGRQAGPRLCSGRQQPARRRTWATAIMLVGSCGLLISPMWALVAFVPAAALVAIQRRSMSSVSSLFSMRLVEITGVAAAVMVACSVLWTVRRDRPIPNAGWTLAVEHLNGLALYSVIALAVGSLFAADADAADERI